MNPWDAAAIVALALVNGLLGFWLAPLNVWWCWLLLGVWVIGSSIAWGRYLGRRRGRIEHGGLTMAEQEGDRFTWEAVPERSQDHWLELRGGDTGERISEQGGPYRRMYPWYAWVKWDGCIELFHCFNGYEHGHTCEGERCACLEEQVHICDIDEQIAILQALKAAAIAWYEGKGQAWPG